MPQDDADLSLVRNDFPFRVQRRLGLIPRKGLGVGRRAILFAAVAWLPIAIWAIAVDRFLPGHVAEPFIDQFSIHARCLIAIPLFVLAEATAHNVGRMIVQRLVDQGFVIDVEKERLHEILSSFVRTRDGVLPWVFVVAVVGAVLLVAPTIERNQEVLFAPNGDLSFGGLWYLYVSRTIFMGLLFGWVWRILLGTYAMVRISRLSLAPVPTHPDRMFGVGVLARTPMAFWPLVFGVSTVLASVWAHDILFQKVPIAHYYVPLGIYAAIVLLLLLSSILVFVPKFLAAKRMALAEYGGLLAQHGRLVHRKWIVGDDVGSPPVLDAPELGPVADTAALYQAVAAQRPAPINKTTLLAVLLPIAVPMLAVAALQIPIGELLWRLVKTVL